MLCRRLRDSSSYDKVNEKKSEKFHQKQIKKVLLACSGSFTLVFFSGSGGLMAVFGGPKLAGAATGRLCVARRRRRGHEPASLCYGQQGSSMDLPTCSKPFNFG